MAKKNTAGLTQEQIDALRAWKAERDAEKETKELEKLQKEYERDQKICKIKSALSLRHIIVGIVCLGLAALAVWFIFGASGWFHDALTGVLALAGIAAILVWLWQKLGGKSKAKAKGKGNANPKGGSKPAPRKERRVVLPDLFEEE